MIELPDLPGIRQPVAIGVNPEIEKRMLAMNVMPMPVGRVETTDFIRVQSEKWRPVLKDLNITFD